ncbi:MAG: hypothetical protein GY820_05440, partial [Gammaproteobacteria bacterium]|nr:hypothetical protein [Gammaproteobacteria bacterium]
NIQYTEYSFEPNIRIFGSNEYSVIEYWISEYSVQPNIQIFDMTKYSIEPKS